MFRMWGKLWKESHVVMDYVVEIEDYSLTRTQMVFRALEEICLQFDLEQPIWLDTNIQEFKRLAKTRFSKDSFIEDLNLQYLEIEVIEEAY